MQRIFLLTSVGRSVCCFIRRCSNELYHRQQMSSYIYIQVYTISRHHFRLAIAIHNITHYRQGITLALIQCHVS